MTYLIFLLLAFSMPILGLEYEASLINIPPGRIHKVLMEGSELLSHRNINIESIYALKRILEQDKAEMLSRAKSFGYLEATVDYSYKEKASKTSISFQANLGNRYHLGTIGFSLIDPSVCRSSPPSKKDIPSFTEGAFFTSSELLSFEHELLYSLLCRGYPKAKIIDTLFEADKSTELLNIFLKIDLGPYTTFGPITIQGTEKVDQNFLRSKIPIQEGSLYKKNQLDEIEKHLLQTGLLFSASFDTSLPIDTNGTLPLVLNVQEAKLQTIGAGLSYMTTIGPGVSCLYENRYFSSQGQKCSVRCDIWKKKKLASVTLTTPSFHEEKQNLLWVLEYDSQTYLPYHSSSASVSCLLERQLSKKTEAVYGVKVEKLNSTHVFSNRRYELLKLPCQLKWNNANSLFDPTQGMALNIRLTPSAQYINPYFSYLIQQSSLSYYTSFNEDRLTLALKGIFGDIVGAKKTKIPIPDRFFGGSDTILRGYKTGTISPTDKKGRFIGGDSMLAGSVELRIRQKQESLGWVLFYDIGEVYKKRYPDKFLSLLHSLGVGMRYSTPIGPLRLDIAFPLNRRKGIDPFMQLYFSIGQAF